MSNLNMRNLELYAREGYNVLLTGKHGVGKTAIINEIFTKVFGEHNKSWMYFSAATLDPWVDFIGIPKNYTTPEGKEVFRIIPPEHFTGDEKIEALFFDEINRGEDKVLNALMELIQFKSINGRKFPNLKCVWGAENPADTEDEYSVRAMDPAQKDRFQIQLNVPYSLDETYFKKKFGNDLTDITKKWWDAQKKKPSPRKMDQILTGFQKGFDIHDFTNIHDIKELSQNLKSVDDIKKIKSIIATKDSAAIRAFMTLDLLRKHEKLIARDKSIYITAHDFVNEELQRYIEKTFNYKPPVDLTRMFTDKARTYMNESKRKPQYNFDAYNFKDVTAEIRYLMESFSDWRTFEFKTEVSVEQMQCIFNVLYDSKTLNASNSKQLTEHMTLTGTRNLYVEFMKFALYMLKHVSSKDMRRLDIYSIFKRFTRHGTMKQYLNINESKILSIENSANLTGIMLAKEVELISVHRL